MICKREGFFASSLGLFFLASFLPLHSQIPAGLQPFGSYGGGPDVINLGDLAVHLSFPVIHKAGRGMNFDYSVNYDSLVWRNPGGSWLPSGPGYGWSGSSPSGNSASFLLVDQTYEYNCNSGGNIPEGIQNNYEFIDTLGVTHSFGSGVYTTYDCGKQTVVGFPATATDNSGIKLLFVAGQPASSNPQLTIQFPSGLSISGTAEQITTALTPVNTQDNNGNYIVSKGSLFSGLPTYTDTLGTVVLSTTDGGTTSTGAPDGKQDGTGLWTDSNATLSYTGGDGNQHSYTVQSTAYEVKTAFGCSFTYNDGYTSYSPSEYDSGPANRSTAARLITKLILPDGTFYSFTYEPTSQGSATVTGRLASVTFPQGGSISYVWGSMCSNYDGTPTSLTRTVKDGLGHSSVWTYQRTSVASTDPNGGIQYQTTVTDPIGNQSIYQFLVGDPLMTSPPPLGFGLDPWYYLETSRVLYAGSASGGALLSTVNTCYDTGSTKFVANCNTPILNSSPWQSVAFPISSKQVTVTPNGGSLTSGTVTSYNLGGLTTSVYAYDYGTSSGTVGPVLSQTQITYSNVLGTILNKPANVTQYGPSGNVLSSSTYTYDGASLAKSNAPNQATVTGSRGNVTTLVRGSGNTTLSYNWSYYDTGLPSSATDPNGTVTSYSYSQCGDGYPTATSVGGLSNSTSWNCVGGVPSSSTDANGNVTQITSYDALWRPLTTLDPLGNTTTVTYPGLTSNSSTTTVSYAGGLPSSYGSTTFDGLGRPILKQSRQGPTSSTYTSVAKVYDPRGYTTWSSLPYSASAGVYTTTGSGLTSSYDALGRLISATDAGGGTLSYTYNLNDTLITQGPAASGENIKSRQLEVNAAGQLLSVCEVTSGTASGSCGQHQAATGFLTTYTYVGSLLASVSENVQAGTSTTQTRSIRYDPLGRKIAETIPETGTSTFTYDVDTSGKCPFTGYTTVETSPGDLIYSVDNLGNQTCFGYDGMHRLLSSQAITGQYSSLTPQTHLVYDAATLSGTAMKNVKGALAEAYTCTGGCSTKLTDTYYSKTIQTGSVLSQMWESTPNSNGYFLTQSTSNANGTTASLSATLSGSSIGIPTIDYGLDTWGRPSTATDATHSLSLVSGTTYSSLTGSVTAITLGNGDADSFGFDANTGRATSFGYAIGGSTPFSVSGSLTWNPNGSLKNLSMTDSSDSTKNQNCSYAMDDINRLASVNCTGSWAQNFSYDPFGNISKSGPSNPSNGQITETYAATYSSATNHVNGGVTATYDANGNQTTTNTNNLTWNATAQPVIVNGVGAIYDAAGRLVETGDAVAAVPNTGSSGSIVISGAEQVNPAGQNYRTTASIAISGTEQSGDTGGGVLIVMAILQSNGRPASETYYPISYGTNSTSSTIAASIASEINANSNASGIAAVQNGASIALTINQVFSGAVSYQIQVPLSGEYSPGSFSGSVTSVSASTYTGPVPAVYDAGTMTATINGQAVTYVWGSSDTSTTIASALTTAINNKDGGILHATSSGGTISLTSNAPGPNANYTVTSSTTYSNAFYNSSFATAATSMSGGYPGLPGASSSGSYTQYVYLPGGSKLATVKSGTLVSATIPLPGGGTAIYNSSGLNYFRHKDWLGSSRLGTTWAHAVYSKEAYAPFGETYDEAGTPDRSFTGQDQDASSADYTYLFRRYDPVAGRWLSPDPLGWGAVSQSYPQSLNRYAYVQNGPMTATDPLGLDQCTYAGNCNNCSNYQNYSAQCGYTSNQATTAEQAEAEYEQASMNESVYAENVYLRNLAVGYWTGGVDQYYDYWTGEEDYPAQDSGANPFKMWPLNGNLLPLPFQTQDNLCSMPVIGGSMDANGQMLSACQWHDNQYTAYQCNATSWLVPLPLPCPVANVVLVVKLAIAGLDTIFSSMD